MLPACTASIVDPKMETGCMAIRLYQNCNLRRQLATACFLKSHPLIFSRRYKACRRMIIQEGDMVLGQPYGPWIRP